MFISNISFKPVLLCISVFKLKRIMYDPMIFKMVDESWYDNLLLKFPRQSLKSLYYYCIYYTNCITLAWVLIFLLKLILSCSSRIGVKLNPLLITIDTLGSIILSFKHFDPIFSAFLDCRLRRAVLALGGIFTTIRGRHSNLT